MPRIVKLPLGASRVPESNPATLRTGAAPLPALRREVKPMARPIAIPMPAWAVENWKDPDLIVEFPPMEKEHWTVVDVCALVHKIRAMKWQDEDERLDRLNAARARQTGGRAARRA